MFVLIAGRPAPRVVATAARSDSPYQAVSGEIKAAVANAAGEE
jgi:hypothetical protein